MGVLVFGNDLPNLNNAFIKNLSPSNNYSEAAVNLFAFLRELDEADIDIIISHYLPEIGLGLAINDRLKRAASEFFYKQF